MAKKNKNNPAEETPVSEAAETVAQEEKLPENKMTEGATLKDESDKKN